MTVAGGRRRDDGALFLLSQAVRVEAEDARDARCEGLGAFSI